MLRIAGHYGNRMLAAADAADGVDVCRVLSGLWVALIMLSSDNLLINFKTHLTTQYTVRWN